jgi:hypothetical protein
LETKEARKMSNDPQQESAARLLKQAQLSMQKAVRDYESLRSSLELGKLEELRALAEAGNSACDSGCDGGCGSSIQLGEELIASVRDSRAGRLTGIFEARKLQGLEILGPASMLEAGNDACDSGCNTACGPSEILTAAARESR